MNKRTKKKLIKREALVVVGYVQKSDTMIPICKRVRR
jgi:hypothetical protein